MCSWINVITINHKRDHPIYTVCNSDLFPTEQVWECFSVRPSYSLWRWAAWHAMAWGGWLAHSRSSLHSSVRQNSGRWGHVSESSSTTYFPAVWPWVNYTPSLCLTFLTPKISVKTSRRSWQALSITFLLLFRQTGFPAARIYIFSHSCSSGSWRRGQSQGSARKWLTKAHRMSQRKKQLILKTQQSDSLKMKI